MGITIKDIAREANVSITTVSRVLNDKPDVSEATKKKVKEIIDDLDYRPNGLARGLVLNKTHTIGLIIPDISNPFFPGVAKGVEELASKLNYSVIYCNTGNNINEEKEAIKLLKSRRVDGMIVSLSVNDKTREELNELAKNKFPVVQIDRNIPGVNIPTVSIDNIKASQGVVNYLSEMGHTKIAHITGNLDVISAQDRLEGYTKGLAGAGLEYIRAWIKEGDYSKESGYKKMREILRGDSIPTAVYAANDMMALGVYQAVLEEGLTIPEDISVVGYDDIEITSLITPRLTTVFQPKHLLGEKAVKLLVNKINKPDLDFADQILNTELIIRDSVLQL